MPSQSLFSGSIATLQKTLNTGSLRHKVLTANIANIDTPNYKAFEVVMEDELKKAVALHTPSSWYVLDPSTLPGAISPQRM